MVDNWRLAHGAAGVLLARYDDAQRDLSTGLLAGNAEACAWRLRALAEAGLSSEALAQVACARSVIEQRSPDVRAPFLVAAARAAVDGGQPRLALSWLATLPDRDAGANLYRGRADGMLGNVGEARLRLARVEKSGTATERADARLSGIELAAANGWIKPAEAIRQLDAFRYRWRGDTIEERALRLGYQTATRTGDMDATLRTGATLYRFYDPARQGADFVPTLQAKLAAALDPAGGLPLDRAAGLFWDYRDLLPGGAEGDLLVSKLAGRLQAAELYQRAAELYEHQLLVRATDLSRGPLSVKVATLYVLAGRPDRAVVAMRKTASADYPDAMLFERKRVEAVALGQLGRVREADAVLQDVPGGGAIRGEMAWKRHDWATVAAETKAQLPAAATLNDVGQAIVLRRAIALAMLRQEDELAALHTRYAPAFGRLPNGAVFAALTSTPGATDPALFAKAMAALPSASPVGDLAELIDASR
jgi:tetratricopeptide (TPR) repeat protein